MPLERRGDRLRRLRDAARLLPFLGVILLAMPLLWTPSDGPGHDTADTGIYLFLAWAGLIAAAAVLGRALAEGPAEGGGQDGDVRDRTGRDGG
jgi:hypothetical protein